MLSLLCGALPLRVCEPVGSFPQSFCDLNFILSPSLLLLPGPLTCRYAVADEPTLPIGKIQRPSEKPAFRLSKSRTAQEGTRIPAIPLILSQTAPQALPPQQEFAIFIQPFSKTSPLANQRLMSHFHCFLAGALVTPDHHQPHIGCSQRSRDPLRPCVQLIQVDPLPDVFASFLRTADAHQSCEEMPDLRLLLGRMLAKYGFRARCDGSGDLTHALIGAMSQECPPTVVPQRGQGELE